VLMLDVELLVLTYRKLFSDVGPSEEGRVELIVLSIFEAEQENRSLPNVPALTLVDICSPIHELGRQFSRLVWKDLAPIQLLYVFP
jgi:hypothetical protein